MKLLYEAIETRLPGPGEPALVVSLVGAGGKTSVMFDLARHFAGRGERVVSATTTKICTPELAQSPAWLCAEDKADWLGRVRAELDRHGHVTLGRATTPDGTKLVGLSGEQVRTLADSRLASLILIEADGAARRPLKAPAAHEPVVPERTGVLLGVMGLLSLGRSLDEATVFRSELLAGLADTPLGAPVTETTLVRLALHPQGLFKDCPQGALRVCLLSQADIPAGPDLAAEVAAQMRRLSPQASAILAVSVRSGLCLRV